MTDGITPPANYTSLFADLRAAHITVATVALGSDADRTLRDIDNQDLIYFRVKVTDATGAQGRLLAEADGLIANPTEGPGNHLCILEVKFEDLGNLPWSLEIDDSATPTLVVNSRIGSKEYVRSNATFFALVYPAVVREILTAILNEDGYEYDPDGDGWRDLWVRFAATLPDVGQPPEGEEGDPRPWIEAAVRSFCDRQPACTVFFDTLTGEALK